MWLSRLRGNSVPPFSSMQSHGSIYCCYIPFSMLLCRYDEAIQNYSTAIELFPSSAIYFSNRSAALLKKGTCLLLLYFPVFKDSSSLLQIASTLTKPEEAKESGTLKERSLLDAKHAIVLDNRYMKGIRKEERRERERRDDLFEMN